jgi:hypothetical protein
VLEVVIGVRIVPEQRMAINIILMHTYSLPQVPRSADIIFAFPPNSVNTRDIFVINRFFGQQLINKLPFITGHKKEKVAWVLNYK